MFPALREALRELRSGFGSDPISLKSAGNIAFDTTNVDWYARNGYKQLYSMLGGGGPAWSGETVTVDSALNLSTVWACTRAIAESSSMLPLSLNKRKGEDRVAVENHPLYRVLHDEPNEKMSDQEWREATTATCVLRGDGFGRIIRRPGSGEVIGIYPLPYDSVSLDDSRSLTYEIKTGNGVNNETFTVRPDKPHDIFHLRGIGFNGLRGASIITMARQSIGAVQAADKYAAKYYAAGGRVPYLLKTEAKFRNDEERKQFREAWEAVYSGTDNFHKAPILEGGLEYQQIGLSPEDAQFLETRQFNIPEICRWFRISPHLVGDLSRATFSNIEHLAIEFVTHTLMAWLVRWEKAVYRCLLTPEEKAAGYYAKHNVNALLRGDFQSRMAGYSQALQIGKNSIDEIRALEDENPLPNGLGKSHFVQGALVVLPGTGEPLPAQQPKQNGGDNAA